MKGRRGDVPRESDDFTPLGTNRVAARIAWRRIRKLSSSTQ
jgi:hypothetical protein